MHTLLTKIKTGNGLFFLIIGLSIFFRFFRFYDFQYFSGDEEMITATIRHIIRDRSPTLLVQSASLGFGLGPFYHYLLTPFYWVTNFNLVNLQALGSLLGVGTTILLYFAGREIGGKKAGLISALLYAGSFFIAIFDRRLVHLTLNPFLTALTFLTLLKILKKQYQFMPLLALPIGFAFHEDASLIVLVLAIVIAGIYWRFPLKHKYGFYTCILLALFFVPLLLAEVRYNRVVSKGITRSILRPLDPQSLPADGVFYPPSEIIDVLARVIFTRPSTFIEQHFCYCKPPPPMFGPFLQYTVIVLLAASFFMTFFAKRTAESGNKLLWVMTGAFLSGLYFYNLVFKGNFYQHYFMVYYPVFILLLAQIILLVYAKSRFLALSILVVYLGINFYALINSSVKYPLYKKIELVKQTIPALGSQNFSIYAANDSFIHGGGWTELYTLYFRPAVKSYQYIFWGWIYAAYSLYPISPVDTDPEKIVTFNNISDTILLPEKNRIFSTIYKDIRVEVIDNTVKSFK